MKKFEEMISLSEETLSKASIDLFHCILNKLEHINKDEIEIHFETQKGFVRISINSKYQNKISFYVDIFNGYCDFFVDGGKEVFIQYKFQTIKEADSFFDNFLSSPIQYNRTETEEGRILKEQYSIVSCEEKKMKISGQSRALFSVKSKVVESQKTFIPWIIK